MTGIEDMAWVPNIQQLDICLPFKFWTCPVFRYSNHLKTGLVLYSNGRFVSGCQMVRYLGGMKTVLKKACLWSKMSSIQMVHQVTWLYHLNAGHPYCPVFRCLVFRWLLSWLDISLILCSKPHGIVLQLLNVLQAGSK